MNPFLAYVFFLACTNGVQLSLQITAIESGVQKVSFETTYPAFYTLCNDALNDALVEHGYPQNSVSLHLCVSMTYFAFHYNGKDCIFVSPSEAQKYEKLLKSEKTMHAERAALKATIRFLMGHELGHIRNNDLIVRKVGMFVPHVCAVAAWAGVRRAGPDSVVAGYENQIGAACYLTVLCLYFKALRAQEKRADLESSQDPEVLRAGAQWLETFAPTAKQTELSLLKNLFVIHPLSSARAAYLRARADELVVNELSVDVAPAA